MKRGMKKAVIICLTATMAFAASKFAYANTQALPNGTIVNQNGIYYLTDSNGKKYSGWFIDSKEDWYYFNDSDKSMKTGWHHDDKDGYWYYLNSDGKMVTGWQTIDGNEYFFQPVRDMGNYHFNDEQEKWLYSINSKVPYGAMYVNTTTPDGSTVNESGVKVTENTTAGGNAGISNTANSGWISENGKWYYVKADGTMASNGWHEIEGKSYYFGSDGAMYANTTTPDGSKVDGNGVKVVAANAASLSSYIGVYDLWNADGPGYQMIITSISDHQICGAYAQIFDNKDTHGRYSEFKTPLSDNHFTVNGNEVKMQMGGAYEIAGWSGVTGTFSSKYTLTYIDGEPAIIDKEYDTYATYLKKAGSLSSGKADDFWEFYSKVQGDYWNRVTSVDYSSYAGSYESFDPSVSWTDAPSTIKITKIEAGYIYGEFDMPGTSGDGVYFKFSAKIDETGMFKYIYTREHMNNPMADDYGGTWEYKFQLAEKNNHKTVVLIEVTDLEINKKDNLKNNIVYSKK